MKGDGEFSLLLTKYSVPLSKSHLDLLLIVVQFDVEWKTESLLTFYPRDRVIVVEYKSTRLADYVNTVNHHFYQVLQ